MYLYKECIICFKDDIKEKLLEYNHCGKYYIHNNCKNEWFNIHKNECFICREKIIIDIDDDVEYNEVELNNYAIYNDINNYSYNENDNDYDYHNIDNNNNNNNNYINNNNNCINTITCVSCFFLFFYCLLY